MDVSQDNRTHPMDKVFFFDWKALIRGNRVKNAGITECLRGRFSNTRWSSQEIPITHRVGTRAL